jgi:hypothetical protein
MSEKKSKTIDKILYVSFSSIFWFYRGYGCFSAMGVQKHYKKTFCKTNRVEKLLQKNRQKVPNRLFLDLFYSRFWAFLGDRRGEFKTTIEKHRKNKSDPVPFLASDPPTYHRVLASLVASPLYVNAVGSIARVAPGAIARERVPALRLLCYWLFEGAHRSKTSRWWAHLVWWHCLLAQCFPPKLDTRLAQKSAACRHSSQPPQMLLALVWVRRAKQSWFELELDSLILATHSRHFVLRPP